MIYFYKGAKGKGKTLTMVKDAYVYHLNGYKIYSNMKSIKFAIYISSEDIMKITKESPLRDCVLLIDEVQTLFNARRSMKKENVQFSFFIQQIRKRNIEMLATTQFSNSVDLIFRQHIDYIVSPHFDKDLNVCKVNYMDLNSVEDVGLSQSEPHTISVVYDATEIFGKYDTKELVL